MRLVHEAREEEPELSMHQAVRRIGARVGVNADTLRGWASRPTSTPGGIRELAAATPRRSRRLHRRHRHPGLLLRRLLPVAARQQRE
jgi:transposase